MSSTNTVEKRARLHLPILFSLTAFLGASLIFIVQPLVSKLLLPAYGGSAAVWTTSSFFFQVVLLIGYIFVHASVRTGRKRQPLTLLPFVVLALAFLPLALPGDAVPGGDASPTGWLIRTLLLMVALPFLVLSTTGPLLQKWYSWTGGPRAEDPYFLYAASNAGSFVGLFSYPFVVEPFMTLSTQRFLWSGAFVLFLVLLAVCALQLRKSEPSTVVTLALEAAEPDEALSLRRQALWVALAFLPSSLMLGVTTHIATDVASVPLLWVVPLAIYILTMVVAFARTARTTSKWLVYAALVATAVSLGLAMSPHALGPKMTAGILFLTLGLVALSAHSLLANGRPSTRHLTRYFVLISFGGALGGLFNSLVAPLIFSRPFEFPLLLATVPLLLLTYETWRKRKYVAAPVLLALVLLILVPINDQRNAGNVIERSRTFYGSYSVQGNDEYHEFVHGTTIHGLQLLSDPTRPVSYYAPEGPVGDVFDGREYDQSTVVGLGIGQLAAYNEAGQKMDFIEIDPEVIRIARDPDLFTYLRDGEGEVTTQAADGRLAIEALDEGSQDLIFLDAFSSDSIPVHLLTEEAMKMYRSRLAEDGLLVVHISNRIFDLVPVIYSTADALDLPPLYRTVGKEEAGDFGQASTYMALPTSKAEADRLLDLGWRDLRNIDVPPKPVRWTDDYSSVLSVLY